MPVSYTCLDDLVIWYITLLYMYHLLYIKITTVYMCTTCVPHVHTCMTYMYSIEDLHIKNNSPI